MAEFKQDTIESEVRIQDEDIFQNQNNDYRKIYNKKIEATYNLPGTQVQDTNNLNGVFWIAPFACTVTAVKLFMESTVSSGTVSVYVEKLTGSQAKTNGVSTLASNISVPIGQSDYSADGTLTSTLANRQLAEGDRLALIKSGTMTNAIGLTLTVELTYN